jgi:Pvc16 N-terminal domain
MLSKIEDADRQIVDWVRSVLAKTDVSLGLPNDTRNSASIVLYLFDVTGNATPRGSQRPPLQVTLRYLVTAGAPRPEDEHSLLVELLFAALAKPEKDEPDFEVFAEPLSIAGWSALGLSPRPSFFLHIPLRRDRKQDRATLVRASLITSSPVRSVRGIVYGPDDLPIMGARVEVPTLGLFTRTDSAGRFHFSTVAASLPIEIKVQAKGKEAHVSLASAAKGDEPLEIRLQGLEE